MNNETVASTTESPVDTGQVSESAVTGNTPEVGTELFNWNEYADRHVRLNVSGEEVDVSLKEALSGYQRQADYTRKTQELGEQRRQVQFGAALQEALQSDAKGTLEMLKEHYGLNAEESSDEDSYVDPGELRIRQLDSRIKAFEQEKAQADLARTVESLSSKYGNAFDAEEVVAKALATRNPNLEAVFKQIAFDRLFENQAVAKNVQSKIAQDESARIQAKRDANVVSNTASARSADLSSKPITTVAEAFELAKRQHNI